MFVTLAINLVQKLKHIAYENMMKAGMTSGHHAHEIWATSMRQWKLQKDAKVRT
jgi:hypothetical protein